MILPQRFADLQLAPVEPLRAGESWSERPSSNCAAMNPTNAADAAL